jgi:hypothetical protein
LTRKSSSKFHHIMKVSHFSKLRSALSQTNHGWSLGLRSRFWGWAIALAKSRQAVHH